MPLYLTELNLINGYRYATSKSLLFEMTTKILFKKLFNLVFNENNRFDFEISELKPVPSYLFFREAKLENFYYVLEEIGRLVALNNSFIFLFIFSKNENFFINFQNVILQTLI